MRSFSNFVLRLFLLIIITFFSCNPKELCSYEHTSLYKTEQPSYTIVTAFFNIDRNNWNTYERSVDAYLENAKRMLSLDDYMVIYIEPEYIDFINKHREKYAHKTVVIPLNIQDLPYYKYKDQIQTIMESSEFKNGLADRYVPEVTKPLYDVVIWSKIPLVTRTVIENPFNTTHFIWLDFGVHKHMLQNHMLNKSLMKGKHIPDQIKLLCRSKPQPQDLDIKTFYRAHRNRFAATMFSGSGANFLLFDSYQDEEICDCLDMKVVDCEQSIHAVIYLKYPELFELYYGDWKDLISNY